MGKGSFFTGQPIFNQLLCLIPRSILNQVVRQYQSDRYCKRFRSYNHLVSMLYASFHQCSSIREVITGMQACESRLSHFGVHSTPRRSTLADANKRRPSELFEDLYHKIYHYYYQISPDSQLSKKLHDRLYIVDSTVVSLFSDIMRSTGSYGTNGKKKGGIKAHVLLRAKDNLPCLVRLSEGKVGDSSFLPSLSLEKGSIVVMDKGYRNFQQFIAWNRNKVTWVSRLHGRTVYRVTEQRNISEKQQAEGILKDAFIELGNPKTARKNPIQQARLVTFRDAKNGRILEFITNNRHFDALTVADLYKKRWQIELFFKRIKQNFQFHSFLGDNENAIRIQMWCTLIADLLLKIVKDKMDKTKRWSLANLSGLVRLHLGTYIHLFKFLANPEKALLGYRHPNPSDQIQLFPITNRGA